VLLVNIAFAAFIAECDNKSLFTFPLRSTFLLWKDVLNRRLPRRIVAEI
jgi:hypothetical protein